MKATNILKLIQNNPIPYRFYHWGPFVWKVSVDPEVTKFLLKESENCTQPFNKQLAGVLSKEMLYSRKSHKRVWDILRVYIDDYLKALKKEWGCDPGKTWNPLNVWINYQKAHDYGPYHMHSGNFSFVLFCSIPMILQKEIKEIVSKTNNHAPGGLSFFYGDSPMHMGLSQHDFIPQENMMLIFPAYVKHMVYPFKSKCTRISVAGNFEVESGEAEAIRKQHYD